MLNKQTGLIILIFALILSTSCKKDFTTIGNKLIDTPHFEGKAYNEIKVTTYDQRVDRVYSTLAGVGSPSNLNVQAVGVYKDAKFGLLKADLASVILPDIYKFENNLGDNIKILGAKLLVPYFSRAVNDNGTEHYELDSIFGSSRFEIKIHELTYLLPSYDPDANLEERRKYYSDFDFSPYKGDLIGDSVSFGISSQAYITYKRNKDGSFELDDNGELIVKDSLGPHMQIKLDTTYFRQKIFDHAGEEVLTSLEKFKDYFRGIYIEAIPENNDGRFLMMPFNKGKIVIQYTYDEVNDNDTPSDTSDDTIETIYKEINLPFGTPMVNHYENTLTAYAQNQLDNSDLINGDQELVIKGDAGSEAIVKLFDDQQLRELRLKDWMINQAELYFYVNENESSELLKPAEKLLLFNYDDQQNLIDIYAPENTDNGYAEYDGNLETDDQGRQYYRFGITRHIRNVLKLDSTNVRLGLRVYSDMKKSLKSGDLFLDPDAYNPKGIILYGNQAGILDRPVLKIRYTDPED